MYGQTLDYFHSIICVSQSNNWLSICLKISTTLPSETASSPPTITQVDHFWAVRRTMEGDSPMQLPSTAEWKHALPRNLFPWFCPSFLPSSIYKLRTLRVYVETHCNLWSEILQDLLKWIAAGSNQDMFLRLARFGPRSCLDARPANLISWRSVPSSSICLKAFLS